MLSDAWINVSRGWAAMLKVFFSVIFAISSGPGAFLGDIRSMARRT